MNAFNRNFEKIGWIDICATSKCIYCIQTGLIHGTSAEREQAIEAESRHNFHGNVEFVSFHFILRLSRERVRISLGRFEANVLLFCAELSRSWIAHVHAEPQTRTPICFDMWMLRWFVRQRSSQQHLLITFARFYVFRKAFNETKCTGLMFNRHESQSYEIRLGENEPSQSIFFFFFEFSQSSWAESWIERAKPKYTQSYRA